MAQCQTKWNLILGSSPCRFRFLLWSIPSFLSMSLCGRCMYHAYLGALPSECLEVLTVIVTWSLQVPQRFLLFEALLGSRASGNPARTVGNLWWTKHLSKSSDCKRLSIKSWLILNVHKPMNTSAEVRAVFLLHPMNLRFLCQQELDGMQPRNFRAAEADARYTAIVLDADVVAVVLDRGLDSWLHSNFSAMLVGFCRHCMSFYVNPRRRCISNSYSCSVSSKCWFPRSSCN